MRGTCARGFIYTSNVRDVGTTRRRDAAFSADHPPGGEHGSGGPLASVLSFHPIRPPHYDSVLNYSNLRALGGCVTREAAESDPTCAQPVDSLIVLAELDLPRAD